MNVCKKSFRAQASQRQRKIKRDFIGFVGGKIKQKVKDAQGFQHFRNIEPSFCRGAYEGQNFSLQKPRS